MRRKELGKEDNRAEKALLTTESDSINLLQLALLDMCMYMGVDDAIIMISGHCMKLDYCGIWAHMGIL